MKTKTLIATALVAISGIAASSATAAGKADTEVSIKGNNGDYFGYVHSSNQSDCEAGRKVNVYKMLGQSPDPKNDLKIGSDTAQPNGPDSMWSTGNSGYKNGKFYAKVNRTDECKGDISNVING